MQSRRLSISCRFQADFLGLTLGKESVMQLVTVCDTGSGHRLPECKVSKNWQRPTRVLTENWGDTEWTMGRSKTYSKIKCDFIWGEDRWSNSSLNKHFIQIPYFEWRVFHGVDLLPAKWVNKMKVICCK